MTYGEQLIAALAQIDTWIYPNNTRAITGETHQLNERFQQTNAYANLLAYDAYTVKIVRNGTTNILNGTALRDAYADALTLEPGGNPLSETNRVALLLQPGTYDLGSTGLDLSSPFVDIFGLGMRESVVVSSSSNTGTGLGTLAPSVDGFRLQSLTLQNTAPAFNAFDDTDDSAFAPQLTLSTAILKDILFVNPAPTENGAPFMRQGVNFYGCTFIDCKGIDNLLLSQFFSGASGIFENCSYDGSGFGIGIAPTGTFTNCTLGGSGFGSPFVGTMSGTYTRCTAGPSSFGYTTVGTVTATFIDCRCTGAGFGQAGALMDSTFQNCISGNNSFVGAALAGSFTNCTAGTGSFSGTTMSGTFTGCLASSTSFSGTTMSGTFTDCTAGNSSFGGNNSTLSGTFNKCVAGTNSFGQRGSVISGTLNHCIAGNGSFGNGVDSSTVSTISGKLYHCKGGNNSFGNSVNITSTAEFHHCTAGTNSFGAGNNGSLSNCAGKFHYCNGGSGSFGYGSTSDAVYTNCEGGSNSFGSSSNGITCAGSYTNCIAVNYSFAGAQNTADGVTVEASGTFINCQGQVGCFGGTTGSFGGALASGRFIDCTATTGSFGSNAGGGLVGANRATASGYFENCRGGNLSFAGHIRSQKTGTFVRCSRVTGNVIGTGTDEGPLTSTGRMLYCDWVSTTASAPALLVEAGAKVYWGRYIPGSGATASIAEATGSAANVAIANILTTVALGGTLTNLISSPNVIVDSDV